jgi:hypothetical protein
MALQNVALTLPEEVLREARHMAVDRGVPLSRCLSMVLEEQVRDRRRYEEARDRQRALMRQGIDLGAHGQITWTRDELHER